MTQSGFSSCIHLKFVVSPTRERSQAGGICLWPAAPTPQASLARLIPLQLAAVHNRSPIFRQNPSLLHQIVHGLRVSRHIILAARVSLRDRVARIAGLLAFSSSLRE